MLNYVAVYCGTRDHKQVVMMVKDRPAFLRGVLMVPGGKIEPGESPEEASRRELYEETGLVTPPGEWVGCLIGKNTVIHWVRVEVEVEALSPRPQETEKPFWTNPHDILNNTNLMPNLRLIFPLIHVGRKGWLIKDESGTWRTNREHRLKLSLDGEELECVVRGMGSEEEE